MRAKKPTVKGFDPITRRLTSTIAVELDTQRDHTNLSLAEFLDKLA